jgi:hypothetical protein
MTFMPLLPAAFFCGPFFSCFWYRAFEATAGRGLLLLFLFTTIVGDNIKPYQQWILIYP